jgi:hypothetical protein
VLFEYGIDQHGLARAFVLQQIRVGAGSLSEELRKIMVFADSNLHLVGAPARDGTPTPPPTATDRHPIRSLMASACDGTVDAVIPEI